MFHVLRRNGKAHVAECAEALVSLQDEYVGPCS